MRHAELKKPICKGELCRRCDVVGKGINRDRRDGMKRAGPAPPCQPDIDDHQHGEGSFHDLPGNDERGVVYGVFAAAAAEYDGQGVPDCGPLAGAPDAGGSGVGAGASRTSIPHPWGR